MNTNTKSSLHLRCNSLPSAPHPILSQFEEHLLRLKSSQATSSLTSSSISHKLNGLQDLLDCTDKLLQLPTTKQALSREFSDELLEGSLRLLDICSTAKDALLRSKETMQELWSVIRRRRGAETEFKIEGGKYLASRKNVRKAIRKALGNLKAIKNEFTLSSSNTDNETLSMLSILKEAEAVTASSLESLLFFISDPKGQLKQRKRSVISKLMQPIRVACDSEESVPNEFQKVDASLQLLISHNKFSSIENLQNHGKHGDVHSRSRRRN